MAYESNSIFWIEVEKIVPNPFQPRREFDQAKLKELADSIRMYGVMQPLVATRREIIRENGAFTTEYELIAGERRLRASKLAGLTQVPVIIRSGEESELVKLELAIIENLQREDLNAVDRALAFKQLADHFGLSHIQVAQKVGRSREYVSNSIRLLNLPETILGALRVNDISDGHARTLLMLNDRPEEQDIVFREILLKKLSVREVERISRKIATEKVRKKDWLNSDPELIEIERQFTETLGTRVQISKTDFGGKLTIDYFSDEDLQKLLELMHRSEATLPHRNDPIQSWALKNITDATPLQSAEPTSVPTTIDAPISSQPETLEADSPMYKDEEVYTRHDSLEHMEGEVVLGSFTTPVVSESPMYTTQPVPPVQPPQPLYTHTVPMAPVSPSYAAPVTPAYTPNVAMSAMPEQTPVPTHNETPVMPVGQTPVVSQTYIPPTVPVAPQVQQPVQSYTPAPQAPYVAPLPVQNSVSQHVAAIPQAPQMPTTPKVEEDETDLYSIKNFSL